MAWAFSYRRRLPHTSATICTSCTSICTSMTISRYGGGYLEHALRDETGVNFNLIVVFARTTEELSYL